MKNIDQRRRFIFDQADIRGEVVTLNESYREVLVNNDLPAPLRPVLGQFLAAVTLLSSTLKFDGRLTIQARGEGPISILMAECSKQCEVRAIARLSEGVDLSTLDTSKLSSLLGEAVLAITIEPKGGERYQGIVPIDADTLAECLEHYFRQSEQLETRIWLAADNFTCAGLLVQALPRQISDSETAYQDCWETAVHLAETVKSQEMLALDQQQLLFRLFHELQVRVFDSQSIVFACSCSRDRSANALKSAGEEEVKAMLAESPVIQIDCQFCNQQYEFTEADLPDLFPDTHQTLH
ncbi:Hsp33 family molecular chaperone HslO [Marinibactrum halimedae]|uniref:33 kDa chaperonin n=1 Tax=Marinibactrum halimedae TaxID=1444977 RepID=A0AA37WM48_9GAMM|nr:Hsp33 family molecular chaperone HslO [Marinibactrum halimedae]MCD9460474.1 Hsp33 family molecular chaperone HslO [Marinibactrum halimedae]GLS25880.1 33 kDa chaperonin [Marinibactrum halimedae]